MWRATKLLLERIQPKTQRPSDTIFLFLLFEKKSPGYSRIEIWNAFFRVQLFRCEGEALSGNLGSVGSLKNWVISPGQSRDASKPIAYERNVLMNCKTHYIVRMSEIGSIIGKTIHV